MLTESTFDMDTAENGGIVRKTVPALSALNKLEGPVALGLVKVLAKKIDPEPTLQERLEAASGVCKLRARDIEQYDPAIGIYLVGHRIGLID